MKKLILLMLLPFGAFSQTLKENTVDEFTKVHTQTTSFESLGLNNVWTPYIRLQKLDNQVFLMFKVLIESMRNKDYKIDIDDRLMLKLENDSIITLHASDSSRSCTGCGAIGLMGASARGVTATYPIFESDINLLKKYRVTKIRLYHSLGSTENDIKEKKQEMFMKLLALFD